MGFSRNFAPERIVVAIYAFSGVCPLLMFLTMFAFPFLDVSVLLPLSFLPLSITYFYPLVALTFDHGLSPQPASPAPLPFQFLMFFTIIALLLFYPLVSYYLWHKHRIAWSLSFLASVSTIGLETYATLTRTSMLVAFCFGVSANLLILYLLWRSKNSFFNQPPSM
jgi:hypothetical protein